MRRVRRAAHFVPGANERMLEKSLALPADALILDLEDAVAPERKDEARRVVAGWLRDVAFGRQERVVRMNALDSPWGAADLEAVLEHPPDAVLVPKVSCLDEVLEIDRMLGRLEAGYGHPPGGVRLLILGTETARGLLSIRDLPTCPRVDALTWGAEDLSAALGARQKRNGDGSYLDVFRYARVMTLIAAVAADVQPLDTVFVEVADLDGLRAECRASAATGFTGKLTIHPNQIEIVNEAFTPTPAEVEESRELMAAFEVNRAAGRMAFRFRDQMVDAPHLDRARRIVDLAQQLDSLD